MIYFIVFFFMLVCVYAFDYREHKRFYWLCLGIIYIALILIAGLRYRIGSDSVFYESFYKDDLPTLFELHRFKYDVVRFEPGFIIFSSIPRTFSSDFTLFQFFHAIVVNTVIFWFVIKNTQHRFLCLAFYALMLYLNLNTQVLRESLAVCLFLLSWPFMKKGNWLIYYAFAIAALFFHTSSVFLLFVPLFCLPGVRYIFTFGTRTIFVILGFLVIGIIIQTQFYALVETIALTDRMMDRVHTYANDEQGGRMLNIVGMLFYFIKTCLIPLMALYFNSVRKKQNELKKFDKLEMMVLVTIYIIILQNFIFIFGRYFNYFGMFTFAYVASWFFTKLKIVRRKKIVSLKFPTYYWFFLLIFYLGINLSSYSAAGNRSGTLRDYMLYYPYSSRLDPQLDPNREALIRYLNSK